MTASFSDDATDLMTWGRAAAFMNEAGWDLRDETGGAVRLGVAGGAQLGVLVERRPELDDEIDGHGLLRAAGGGGLDVALARSVTAQEKIDDVFVGFNWTFVRAGPYCGIARGPARGTEGARTARAGEPIAGRTLAALAGWLCSLDPLRRSLGLAAVNAFWNRPDSPEPEHTWGLRRFDPPGSGLVIIGGFRAAMQRLPEAKIVEREPKGDDIPADHAQDVLADAQALAITAQALMNGSLEPLLARTGHIPLRLLVGPSAPAAPAVLDHGLAASDGLAITDPDAARAFIAETGTMIALDHMTRVVGVGR